MNGFGLFVKLLAVQMVYGQLTYVTILRHVEGG